MECANHPGRETESKCRDCGKAVCDECAEKTVNGTYCKECQEKGKAAESLQCDNHPEKEAAGKCNECGKAFCSECTEKIGENLYCKACIDKGKQNLVSAVEDLSKNINWGMAFVAGLVVALIGAVIWDKVEIWFKIRLGIIAIAIGYGVGWAVCVGAGGKRGTGLQIMSVVLTLTGIAGGLFFTIHDYLLQEAAKGTTPMNPGSDWLMTALVFPMVLPQLLSPMTLIIIAIGIWQAWVIPAMPKIDLGKPD
ncbi:MAG: hypothetical protein RDV48_30340 [Candidatus Eremiobacteraeota bacterium]|nr:hypothetical protein [Candidatus Eremiobacteraeota bacterium]